MGFCISLDEAGRVDRLMTRLSAIRSISAWLAVLLFGSSPVLALEAPVALSFGVVPQQSASRLAEEWGPLLAEVSRRAGVALKFQTAPGIPQFEQRLAKGEYDLAYMNPYHYVVFHSLPGYQAFAKEQDRKIRGIVVVRKDSRYRKLADLGGQTVVFPAPAAFAASILAQAEFGRLKMPVETRFVNSHDSVYLAVASGLHEAGGGIQRTLEASPVEVREALRVLSETPAYTPHAFAAHPRVPAESVSRVLAAMASLASDAVGQRLLQPLAFKGIGPARDVEWNDIRSLNIELLERYGRP